MQETLTEDTRGLTNVNPITFKAIDITFYEMIITGNYAKSIEFMIKGKYNLINSKPEIYSFDSDRKIYQDGNTFIVEYGNIDLRNNDKELFKVNFGKDNEKGIHNPQFCGYFDYNNKYYLILDSKERPKNEIDEKDKEKGVYKGVILNPANLEECKKEGKKKINDILK